MKKILPALLILALCLSCQEDTVYQPGEYFTLDRTQVSFTSSAAETSIPFFNARGETKASVISENSEWCSVSVSGDRLTVKVTENILARSRSAKVLMKSADEEIQLFVRQARKYFTRIAAVQNLQAVPGLGEVTLKWEEPVEDNFSHVVIRYSKNNAMQEIVLEKGTTEYTVKELKNADGAYEFSVQSIDTEGESGETAKVSAVPGKLVAMRFKDDPPLQWLPYYLKTTDLFETTLEVGSIEFNQGEEIRILFETDPALLAAYNQQKGTDIQLLPQSSYSLPGDFAFNGSVSFQEMRLEINTSSLQDRTCYGLPIRIQSAEPAMISDIKPATIMVFNVDDLAGWYTVDRLPKCGESESNYPPDALNRRRYIKRTGATTWETGYLFRSYSQSEGHTGSGGSVQYISIDPDTRIINIRQGDLAVSENHNVFDLAKNELTIEYLYRDWAGWWTHERMYNRSISREF